MGAAPGGAWAAASPWTENEHGAVRLIAAGDTVGTAETLSLGLHFRMRKGWKIYWRSPGDAGFPPRPNWAGSENLLRAELSWPAPHRFSVLGLQTVGYKDEVVLPVRAFLLEPGKALRLTVHLDYLTCEDICVPYTVKLALALPAGPETTSREAGPIDTFRSRVPRPGGAPGLTVEYARLAESGDRRALLIGLRADRPMVDPDVFIEGTNDVAFARPSAIRTSGGSRAVARVALYHGKGRAPEITGKKLTFTVVDGDLAAEQPAVVTPAASVPEFAPLGGGRSVLFVLVLAFLGGLILNLMPCVLPVLSIKLLSVIGHGGGQRHAVRRSFLASAAGIVASFLVLAAAAVGLRAAGHAVGWGMQFQQPMFLIAMIAILTVFACNLWGMFEFRLPGVVADAASGAGDGHPLTGHFLTGAFATLLATPCTAPFLGTAVGFALAHGAADTFAVFAVLGLGLAAPYLAVSVFPGLATRLPRPGPWMATLKKALALALAATGLWLATVLAAQTGTVAAVMVVLLMATVAATLWQLKHLEGRARAASWAVVAALAVIALVGGARFADFGAGREDSAAAASLWHPFDRNAITDEVRRGRVVLVDVTADWCLTCKVNKALVLDRDPVLARLRSGSVVAMRADWTRPDPRISAYLETFGRFGIPFNAVYGPGTPQGEPLPELLTADAVVRALDRAAAAGRLSRR